MTIQEKCNRRDLNFSQWIRICLPDSKIGFMVSDIDFFMYNYKTKRCMFLEVKIKNGAIKEWQRNMYRMLNKWIKKGIDYDWKFLGIHLITFEKTSFNDGKVYFDKKEISEKDLIKKLSFEE